MKLPAATFFSIVFFSNVYSADISQSIDFRTGADINATLGSRFVSEARYEIVFDRHWHISPGFMIAPGWSFLSAYNIEAGYQQLFLDQLSVHLKFLNRAYQEIEIGENSIIPYLSWRSRNFEADFGLNICFTVFNPDYINLIFYYPSDLVQPFFVFRIAGYLSWENPDIRLGIEVRNNEWNYAGSSLDLSFNIDGIYQIGRAWALKLNMGVTPSGISGASLDFNRFHFLVGAQYRIGNQI